MRGTAFDASRNVAYAITARQIDPLYAIDIADPRNLRILSAIDGLSGDVSVFRLIGDNKVLLTVGRDNSATCTGFEENAVGTANIAVSIIDATDLTKLRLVQRKCIDVKNAGWVNSEVTWNLDQAHKMLGMHADADLNVLTVPVSYWKRNESSTWWWYRYETAVGILSWDLAGYKPSASHLDQTVIQSHGTFIHPNGEVRRSILFKHQQLQQRLMANLSDTHISIANIQDLAKPSLESIVEVAPYRAEIFRFGDYVVEQSQLRSGSWWDPSRGAVEFRVKRTGGDIDDRRRWQRSWWGRSNASSSMRINWSSSATCRRSPRRPRPRELRSRPQAPCRKRWFTTSPTQRYRGSLGGWRFRPMRSRSTTPMRRVLRRILAGSPALRRVLVGGHKLRTGHGTNGVRGRGPQRAEAPVHRPTRSECAGREGRGDPAAGEQHVRWPHTRHQ